MTDTELLDKLEKSDLRVIRKVSWRLSWREAINRAIPKYQPDTKEWWIKAGEVALQYVNSVIPCGRCQGPVIKGHCCTNCLCSCGSTPCTCEDK